MKNLQRSAELLTSKRSLRESMSSFSGIQVKKLDLFANSSSRLLKKGKNQKNKVPEKYVEIGCVSQEGVYHDNEDRMSYGINLNEQIDGFVAVFDGHGGHECADYVAGAMDRYLVDHFPNDESWDQGEEIMHDMFHHIEAEFVEIAEEEEDTSGSCATVVCVRRNEALIANIGDCKAIAVTCRGEEECKYEVLTGDHRADAPDENIRINQAGGSVVDGRVGTLQPSRSFGDIDVKEIMGAGVVIPTPEVSRVKISPGGFMIVATDGLWDNVDDDSVVKYCKEVLVSSNNDAEAAAEELVELAVAHKSTDDITVAVLVWSDEN